MNTGTHTSVDRIGILWRGERGAERLSERATTVLGPLFDAFDELGVATERIVYADDAIDEVRDQLQRVDGVLVWVNPIQDGANRAQLDNLLREVSAGGVWVCAHPDVIMRMGTKEVLFRTKTLGAIPTAGNDGRGACCNRSSPCGQGGSRVSTTRHHPSPA